MRILLTGGAGFIGASIIPRLLNRGDEVRVLDIAPKNPLLNLRCASDRRLDWTIASVSDGNAVASAARGCDAILHLAAMLTPACTADPIRAAQVNVIGTLNMFEAARLHKLKGVLYMSSAAVYASKLRDCPHPETHYGAFKLAAEGAARAYWADHRIASVGLRPYVVFGAGREVGLTAGPALACRAAVEQRAYSIPFTGSADFVYVDDVASAFVEAAVELANGRTGPSVFDIPGEAASVQDVIRIIQRYVPGAHLNSSGPLLPIQLPHKLNDIRAAIRNVVRTPLEIGLKKTIDGYAEMLASGPQSLQ